MPTTLKKLISPIKDRIPLEEELLPPNERLRAGNKPSATVDSPSSILSKPSSGGFIGGSARNGSHIPISDITGSRGLVSQTDWIKGVIGGGMGAPVGRDASLPIDSETGDKKIPEIPERFRRFLEQGALSVDSYIPDKLGSIAGVMEQTASEFSFEDWADKTTGQQRADIQRSGLSAEDQMTILNAAPHYVETIATVQTLYANRAALGLTTSEFKELADELFAIANARDDAINRTGKFEYDRGFAPKALQLLDEREKELLDRLPDITNEDGQDTWYNGEKTKPATEDDSTDTSPNSQSEDYIQVPGQSLIGPNRNVPAVNCYGYILMYLGIEPSDGSYDIQPGQLSAGYPNDHAHSVVFDQPENTDTESLIRYFVRDLEETGRDVRVVQSYEDANEEETIVALKNQNFIIGGEAYHFAIQLPDGSWADKRGTGNDSQQGAIKDPDEPWVGNWYQKTYDTETIYFAISQP